MSDSESERTAETFPDPSQTSVPGGQETGPSDGFTVVGVGASAGGLEAFTEFLQYLPRDTGLAFVLVQHLDPRHPSILADLLAQKTQLTVAQVQDGTRVEPNRIYVIPPNTAMAIHHRTLNLTPRSTEGRQHRPIDVFFASLAEDLHSAAIGVVFSGTASDGTLGLKAIKAEGGITFAQDDSAKFDSMPRNAITAGVVDFVLSPRHIAEEIALISAHPYRRRRRAQSELIEQTPEMHRIMVLLRNRTGVDFARYKQPTILRRLGRRMILRKAESVDRYLAILQREPEEIRALFDDLLISVTEFFRDPDVFEALKHRVFPELTQALRPGEPVRFWVPGCASGEEVYSLAMALAEYFASRDLDPPVQMFGTDVSEAMIEKARAGIYDLSSVSNVSPERLSRFFTRVDSGYQISQAIRGQCIFSRHNIAKDPPLSRMHFISCRNLLIYFEAPLRKRVIVTFGYALLPRGKLLLGSSESLGGMAEYFEIVDQENKIFARKEGVRPSVFDFSERVPGAFQSVGEPIAMPPAPVSRQSLPALQKHVDPVPLTHLVTDASKEPSAAAALEPASNVFRSIEDAEQIAHLQSELTSTREYLQSIIEELRSTNEEAQSANEELQSTNEELQTAKEELQSTNEELNTVNAEMQGRNAELTQANNDLLNLLSSMNTPVVMLSADLRIRRFTPSAESVLHLIPTDTGRPISDLNHRLSVPNLDQVLRGVLDTLISFEEEVQDHEGRWYTMRVRPYRTSTNRIEGAVLELHEVSELKKNLEEIRDARDYAQAIVDTVRAPLVVLDQKLCVQNANRSFYDFFDTSASESVGRNIYEVGREAFRSDLVRALLAQMGAGNSSVNDVEVTFTQPGNSPKTMLLNGRRIQGGGGSGLTLVAFEDITERKRAAEARYRRLFEAARDGIIILDAATGEVTDINPFIEQLSGYSRDRVVGLKLWETPFLENADTLRGVLEQIRDQGVVRLPDFGLVSRDGKQLQTEVIANIYSETDRRSIQLNVRDLTERKRFERELQHTQKLESLGLLAGGIAHDCNNLLTGILGNASLALADTPVEDPVRKYLRDVIGAAERAAFLTAQMLAYAGKGRFVTQVFDLGESIREISALIATSIPKTVEVNLDLTPGLPPVEADPSQIQQLVMNLIINAAEAILGNQPGRVDVRTGQRDLTEEDVLTTYAADKIVPGTYVSLEVKDTGIGMDENTRARIFDPFFTTKFTGRGLGLAAVQGIVKGHRGVTRVYSRPGLGSSFQILLPASSRPVRTAAPSKRDRFKLRQGTVLVIDDEEMIRQLAKAILTQRGFRVLTATNGSRGVEVLREHSKEIDVVILDLLMPVMGGEEALELLHEISTNVPIVLSSGLGESEAEFRLKSKRFTAFLKKPYGADTLIEAVDLAMSRKVK